MAKMMRLMSMKQYSKMTKASLVRKIMKALKKMPKMKLARLCYEIEKSRLPTISTIKKGMPRVTARPARKKPRSPAQRRNDKKLGLMAKRRARVNRFRKSGGRRISNQR